MNNFVDARENESFEENKNYSYQLSNISVVQDESISPSFRFKNKDTVNPDDFKILDPNDPLMEKFQHALKSHLTRINNELSDEINELEIAIKDANKTHEDEAVILYEIQQESIRQETAIENYKDILADIVNLRLDIEERLKKVKETYKNANEALKNKKSNEKTLSQTIESLDALQQQFSKWENDLVNNLTISQRISEKDTTVEKKLLYEKQQKDYILYKLEDEIWKLKNDIKNFEDQLQIKDKEKISLTQTIADANADLEGLDKEHKTLYNAWNSVLNLINQRDKINEEIITEQRKIHESLQNLEIQILKIKKDSSKEMETNERLTSLQSKINEEIEIMKKSYETDREQFFNLETDFIKASKFLEQSEKELDTASMEYESIVNEENSLNKVITKFQNEKCDLEDGILSKLDHKISHDKVIRHLNKLLHEAKDYNIENELNLARFENLHGKSLFEYEKCRSNMENEKFDLNALVQKNLEKQKEIDALHTEIKNWEISFKQKKRKIEILNKKIEQMLESCSNKEVNPLNAKITLMENDIYDTEKKMKEAQKFWLRQQGYIFALSKQRDLQMQELNVIAKEIILMDQKNYKVEIELEKQKKEEINVNRAMNALQQKLVQINLKLAAQKNFENKLEDKNNSTKNEYIKSLEESEIELIKLETDIKNLTNEKFTIKEELKFVQQESLSWEKKVQLANEANKSYKEERNSGGNVAIMKSEIHKMEMRLSYLRKAQEKLVNDMEYCISRRDSIIDKAIAREKVNPKNQHNQRIILKKRLNDQKTKIKQITKEIKQIQNNIKTMEVNQKKLFEYLTEGQKLLRQNEDIIPDIEKQITEAELIKHHNLEVLVRKQRKVNLLRDLKNGQYKSIIKNETILDEEWQNQQDVNKQLKEIMQQTEHDFPLLKNSIRKIILTLEN